MTETSTLFMQGMNEHVEPYIHNLVSSRHSLPVNMTAATAVVYSHPTLNALLHPYFNDMKSESENEHWGMETFSSTQASGYTSAIGSDVDFLEESYVTGNSMDASFNNLTEMDNRTLIELPIDMQFNEGHRLAVTIYSLLMIVSAIGNISVLAAIVKLRIKGRLSRINMFLLHLVVADLLVTFLMMPLEIIWNATVSWHGGDMMCRIMSFFRIFGLYLSGFILICISLDRYFAVLKPLAIPEANSRGKIMLVLAWIVSILCSLPQSFIFHVETHPVFKWYEQCVTFNSFPSQEYELAYNFFGFVFLYGIPLIMIIVCYSRILFEIYRINALKKNEDELRRSNMGALGRAKIRTLKMTVIIVATFFFCWTPYNVMSLWYWFDRKSAQEVDQRIQKGLFLFACTNSCVNPLIYGLFHFRPRKNSSSTNVQRSFPNGYRRPPVPSDNYKMRVRWKPNECCIMGCGSSANNETSQNGSSPRGNKHVHMRPTQQLWVGDSKRHCNGTHSQILPTQRDITITNGNIPRTTGNDKRSGPFHQNNGHVRFSDIQITEQPLTRTTTFDNHINRHNYIDDKNSRRTYLSSVL